MSSDGVLAGSMFWAAQMCAWDIVMSRKSSQASDSISAIFFGSFWASANIRCSASFVIM